MRGGCDIPGLDRNRFWKEPLTQSQVLDSSSGTVLPQVCSVSKGKLVGPQFYICEMKEVF